MAESENEPLTSAFREVMAGVATPVTVVTAMDGRRPHGTTVSAFASLSMRPPMVLIALDRRSELLALITSSLRFGVNVLGHGQSALALAFARKGGAGRFTGVSWEVDWGVPRLSAAPGWLACEMADVVEGGDHVIALGNVLATRAAEGAPLTYHARAFGTHVALA
ncbi:flavin reductase family protein [Streptomyces yatensis]|uniref:Flavin reductase like domain-containing protein n=1 Tax=Streptomyces yatensis TaxID=155177 RepID=A0ABN2I5F7_9ACTN|nr:flavin reductase family protein [Streptomyces yatensis]